MESLTPLTPQPPCKQQQINKHKTNANCCTKQNQPIIHQHILPNLTAALSQYQSDENFSVYLTANQIGVTVNTWIPSSSDSTTNGNSTEPVSTLLAELESILHTFPEIQHDEILHHLNTLEPMSFIALNNANDTLMQSQMLHTPDKQEFLNAKDDKIKGLIQMDAWKY